MDHDLLLNILRELKVFRADVKLLRDRAKLSAQLNALFQKCSGYNRAPRRLPAHRDREL